MDSLSSIQTKKKKRAPRRASTKKASRSIKSRENKKETRKKMRDDVLSPMKRDGDHESVITPQEELTPPSHHPRVALLWSIVATVTVFIIIVWVAVIRLTLQQSRSDTTETQGTFASVRDEIKKTTDQFQQNLEELSTILRQQFSTATSTGDGQELSPEALSVLQQRIDALATGGAVSFPPVREEMTAPTVDTVVETDPSTWTQYQNDEVRVRFRYPTAWESLFVSPNASVSGDAAHVARIVSSFVSPESFFSFHVFVRDNPKNVSLQQFYAQEGQESFFADAENVESIFIDGIRGLRFANVGEEKTRDVVSVRFGTRVFEFQFTTSSARTRDTFFKHFIPTIDFLR